MSNDTLTQIFLTPPNTIKSSKKNEKIVYSEIVANGKKGIFVNVNSKTPDNKQTLYKFNERNIYIYVSYTEEMEMVFMEIIENMDVESDDLLQDKFLIAGVLQKYKEDGYIKLKIDIDKFGKTFFQQEEEDKKGKKMILKNMNYENFENDNIITNGVYSLKISGVWRKENSTSSRFSIKVLAVLVNSFYKSSNEEENDETGYLHLLATRSDNSSDDSKALK